MLLRSARPLVRRTGEHLLTCHRWTAERHCLVEESTDVIDVFKDFANLMDFLSSSVYLPPHIGMAQAARHDNNKNN